MVITRSKAKNSTKTPQAPAQANAANNALAALTMRKASRNTLAASTANLPYTSMLASDTSNMPTSHSETNLRALSRQSSSPKKAPARPAIRQAPWLGDSIDITEAEVKAALSSLIVTTINAHHGAALCEPGAQPAIEEEIKFTDPIDSIHMAAFIRYLVSKNKHLEKTVGVFPAFSAEYFNAVVDLVYNKMIVQPEFAAMLPCKDALPEVENVSEHEREAIRISNANEIAERNRKEAALREKAREILSKKMITESVVFGYFLESVSVNPTLLGNPKSPNLPFQRCQQFIVPIRMAYANSMGHYAVAVVDCYAAEEPVPVVRADIKFYDSMGSDISEPTRMALANFFHRRYRPHPEDLAISEASKKVVWEGYNSNTMPVVQYYCMSAQDQHLSDNSNCALFAGIKSIDIACDNFGHLFAPGEYTPYLNYLRSRIIELRELLAEALKAMRFRVRVIVPIDLRKALKDWHINAGRVLNLVGPNEVRFDLDELYKACEERHRLVLQQIYNLQMKLTLPAAESATLSLAEQVNLEQLQALNSDYAKLAVAVQNILASIVAPPQTPAKDEPILLTQMLWQYVREFPWTKAAFSFITLGLLGYFGGPWLIKAASFLGSFLPTSPVATFLGGGFLFVMGLSLISQLAHMVGAGNELDYEDVTPPSQQQQAAAQASHASVTPQQRDALLDRPPSVISRVPSCSALVMSHDAISAEELPLRASSQRMLR